MNNINSGLFVKLNAKSGMETELSDFLKGALSLAKAESGTQHWFAVQFDERTYGVFDTFSNDEDRNLHLNGPIAKALLANAEKLLSEMPRIERIDIIAAK